MNKNLRMELIEKSIGVKTFKDNNFIFVNLLTALKPFAFGCDIKDLSFHLNNQVLQVMPIISGYTISGKEMPYGESVFKNINVDDSDNMTGTLSCGQIVKCNIDDFDYKFITPSENEYRKLILKSIQDF